MKKSINNINILLIILNLNYFRTIIYYPKTQNII